MTTLSDIAGIDAKGYRKIRARRDASDIPALLTAVERLEGHVNFLDLLVDGLEDRFGKEVIQEIAAKIGPDDRSRKTKAEGWIAR